MDLAKLNELKMPKARLLFCEKYLENYDIEDAFKTAYPDIHIANGNYYSRARRMLKRRDVQLYVAHRREDMQNIMCLDANRIAQEIAAVAFTNITDVMEEIDKVKTFDQMSTAAKKAIKKIIIKEVETRSGMTTTTTTIEMHDKLRGLNELMKVLGIGAGDASPNVAGDMNVTNNIIQVNATDLTDKQLRSLVSTGQLSSDILNEPEYEEIDIPDEDFS